MGRYERRRKKNRRIGLLLILLILMIIVGGTIAYKAIKGGGLPSFNWGSGQKEEITPVINPYQWTTDTPEEEGDIETPAMTKEEKEALEASILQKSESLDSIIKEMSLREKICQMHVISPETVTPVLNVTAAGDSTQSALSEYPVGGFAYSNNNFLDEEQTKEMFSNLQKMPKVKLLTVVEEEGGDNGPLMNTVGETKFKNMFEYWNDGVETARANGKAIGAQLKTFGLNTNLAPVANILTSDETTIGKRAYSDDYAQGAELVAAAVNGYHEGGVATTLKYYPSFGVTSKTLEELKEAELLPFIKGIEAGADMVMVGESVATQLDSEPAFKSGKLITEVLRGELGFEGVVISDAMDSDSVTAKYQQGELSVAAIKAGVDIIYKPASLDESIEAIEKAVESGEITEEQINQSVKRILTLKTKIGLL